MGIALDVFAVGSFHYKTLCRINSGKGLFSPRNRQDPSAKYRSTKSTLPLDFLNKYKYLLNRNIWQTYRIQMAPSPCPNLLLLIFVRWST